MSKPATKRRRYVPPIAFDRLQAMIAVLESDRELPSDLRREIADALDCLFVTQLIEEKLATPDRRVDHLQRHNACLAHQLRSEHGASVKAAVLAVLPADKWSNKHDALARAYRGIKQRREFDQMRIDIHETVVTRAVARLPVPKKSGNK